MGVTEHGNSVVLVTIASDSELLDRRRVDLTSGLPTHPHHHEGSWAVGRYRDSPWAREITLSEAVELVERVREAAACGCSGGPRRACRDGIRADCHDRDPRMSRAAGDDRGTHRRQPGADRCGYGDVPTSPCRRGRGARLDRGLVRPRRRVRGMPPPHSAARTSTGCLRAMGAISRATLAGQNTNLQPRRRLQPVIMVFANRARNRRQRCPVTPSNSPTPSTTTC